MRKFVFNTGVKPYDHSPPAGMAFIEGYEDSGNGVYVIPFYCEDIPENATFVYACDHDIPGNESLLKRKIHNSVLISKYAFFKI